MSVHHTCRPLIHANLSLPVVYCRTVRSRIRVSPHCVWHLEAQDTTCQELGMLLLKAWQAWGFARGRVSCFCCWIRKSPSSSRCKTQGHHLHPFFRFQWLSEAAFFSGLLSESFERRAPLAASKLCTSNHWKLLARGDTLGFGTPSVLVFKM